MGLCVDAIIITSTFLEMGEYPLFKTPLVLIKQTCTLHVQYSISSSNSGLRIEFKAFQLGAKITNLEYRLRINYELRRFHTNTTTYYGL